ncbi:DUF465 domain-containing protein [Suttonella sp. R2A3]|uniref:YdcH family protein n=1 Tax=Suttonella sp. R2A3 TaxID=2908648 RepID=UPI001F3A458B|nr:DUF465 domain-containing protein [Suttonella sp. R2A3]UJF24287.1 DUF465 domain-containing protein [Suttonella sp. R2A3]
MLHEYRELIAELKQSDNHFAKLFNEHNELDEEVNRLENDPVAVSRHDEIEQKKRRKLKLKDEIYDILRDTERNRNS